MNSYERVMSCFAGEKPDRVPIFPIIREWCCKQAGIRFSDTADNVEKHVYSQYYCAKKFGWDIVYDLIGVHAESEAMGSEVKYAEGFPPTVACPAIKNYEEDLPKLKILNPYKDGRLPLILEGIKRLKELCDGEIPVVGTVQAPFRHAAMLRGTDNLLKDTFKDKENARKLVEIATLSQIIWAVAVVQAGADIVYFVDSVSSGDVVSTKTYKEWGFLPMQKIIMAVKKTGVPTLFHICGDNSDRLEILASTGVDALSLDSKVDLGFASPSFLLSEAAFYFG